MRVQHYQTATLSAASRGYLDGLTDARNDRTPEHSHSAYQFPRELSLIEQRDYTDQYYEAKAKYHAASELDKAWIQKQNERGIIEL